jgi:hypothetical protein
MKAYFFTNFQVHEQFASFNGSHMGPQIKQLMMFVYASHELSLFRQDSLRHRSHVSMPSDF